MRNLAKTYKSVVVSTHDAMESLPNELEQPLESFSLEIETNGTPDQGSEDNRSCGIGSNTGAGYRSDRTTGHPPRATPENRQ